MKIYIFLNQILADKCGKTLKQIETDTDRDFYLTAEEAVKYGIADSIATNVLVASELCIQRLLITCSKFPFLHFSQIPDLFSIL